MLCNLPIVFSKRIVISSDHCFSPLSNTLSVFRKLSKAEKAYIREKVRIEMGVREYSDEEDFYDDADLVTPFIAKQPIMPKKKLSKKEKSFLRERARREMARPKALPPKKTLARTASSSSVYSGRTTETSASNNDSSAVGHFTPTNQPSNSEIIKDDGANPLFCLFCLFIWTTVCQVKMIGCLLKAFAKFVASVLRIVARWVLLIVRAVKLSFTSVAGVAFSLVLNLMVHVVAFLMLIFLVGCTTHLVQSIGDQQIINICVITGRLAVGLLLHFVAIVKPIFVKVLVDCIRIGRCAGRILFGCYECTMPIVRKALAHCMALLEQLKQVLLNKYVHCIEMTKATIGALLEQYEQWVSTTKAIIGALLEQYEQWVATTEQLKPALLKNCMVCINMTLAATGNLREKCDQWLDTVKLKLNLLEHCYIEVTKAEVGLSLDLFQHWAVNQFQPVLVNYMDYVNVTKVTVGALIEQYEQSVHKAGAEVSHLFQHCDYFKPILKRAFVSCICFLGSSSATVQPVFDYNGSRHTRLGLTPSWLGTEAIECNLTSQGMTSSGLFDSAVPKVLLAYNPLFHRVLRSTSISNVSSHGMDAVVSTAPGAALPASDAGFQHMLDKFPSYKMKNHGMDDFETVSPPFEPLLTYRNHCSSPQRHTRNPLLGTYRNHCSSPQRFTLESLPKHCSSAHGVIVNDTERNTRSSAQLFMINGPTSDCVL